MLCGKLHCQKSFRSQHISYEIEDGPRARISPEYKPSSTMPHTKTRNPTPDTRNTKHETQNLKPDTRNRNPKPETRHPKPETRNPKHETRNPKPETRNPKPETRDSNQSNLTFEPQAFPTQETPAPLDPEAGPSETHNLSTSILEKQSTSILEKPAAEIPETPAAEGAQGRGGEPRERGQIDGQISAGAPGGVGGGDASPAWKWESLERDGPLVPTPCTLHPAPCTPSCPLLSCQLAALERGNSCAKSQRADDFWASPGLSGVALTEERFLRNVFFSLQNRQPQT